MIVSVFCLTGVSVDLLIMWKSRTSPSYCHFTSGSKKKLRSENLELSEGFNFFGTVNVWREFHTNLCNTTQAATAPTAFHLVSLCVCVCLCVILAKCGPEDIFCSRIQHKGFFSTCQVIILSCLSDVAWSFQHNSITTMKDVITKLHKHVVRNTTEA